jgi:hypothetical protein
MSVSDMLKLEQFDDLLSLMEQPEVCMHSCLGKWNLRYFCHMVNLVKQKTITLTHLLVRNNEVNLGIQSHYCV